MSCRLANRQKGAQQRFMEVRFWDESKKRGTDIEFEDYYQDTDGVLKPNDKNRVKTDGQNKAFRLGKFAIIETEVDANESGVSKAKKKKGSDKVTVYRNDSYQHGKSNRNIEHPSEREIFLLAC